MVSIIPRAGRAKLVGRQWRCCDREERRELTSCTFASRKPSWRCLQNNSLVGKVEVISVKGRSRRVRGHTDHTRRDLTRLVNRGGLRIIAMFYEGSRSTTPFIKTLRDELGSKKGVALWVDIPTNRLNSMIGGGEKDMARISRVQRAAATFPNLVLLPPELEGLVHTLVPIVLCNWCFPAPGSCFPRSSSGSKVLVAGEELESALGMAEKLFHTRFHQ